MSELSRWLVNPFDGGSVSCNPARHPGYAGAIVAAITLPISLGSLWAPIPAAIGAFGFGFRTAYEDRILSEELSEYDEYSQRVRFRLIPGVW